MTDVRAIRATHAFDGERFLLGGATVLLDGATIAAVGAYDAALPTDVPVTEHDGTLLPGLIDCHVHLVADSTPTGLERVAGYTNEQLDATILDSLAVQARAGVTTVRDLGDRGFRTLDAPDGPGIPRVIASGPPITTPGGHCHYLGGAVDGGQVRAAVRAHAARGVDVIKVMASGGMLTPGTDVFGAQFTEAELRELADAAHEAGLRVLAHTHSLAGARVAVAAGVDGLEHLSCLVEGGPHMPDDLLAAIAAAGITVDVTTGFDPDKLPPPSAMPPQMRLLMERLGATMEDVVRNQQATALRLREHGIRMVVGHDAGVGPQKAHGNLWRSVHSLVDGGYPVAEALAGATSVAAADCGLAGTTGALRAGLAADLLVVDGDVERDVTALARPVLVLARGAEVPVRVASEEARVVAGTTLDVGEHPDGQHAGEQ